MELLLARVRAMLRRREVFTPTVLTCGNISLNQQSYELSANGQSFVLPKLEYQLITQAYEKYKNVRDAAASLGMDSSTFVRKRRRCQELLQK